MADEQQVFPTRVPKTIASTISMKTQWIEKRSERTNRKVMGGSITDLFMGFLDIAGIAILQAKIKTTLMPCQCREGKTALRVAHCA